MEQPKTRRLPDGHEYPITKTVRDRVTGKVYDYVARPRFVSVNVKLADGSFEPKQVLVSTVCHVLERVEPKPAPAQQPEKPSDVRTLITEAQLQELNERGLVS